MFVAKLKYLLLIATTFRSWIINFAKNWALAQISFVIWAKAIGVCFHHPIPNLRVGVIAKNEDAYTQSGIEECLG